VPKLRDHSTIESRIWTRTRGGAPRYWVDFRDYAEVGGKQEALCPQGTKFATSDPVVARSLAETRLAQLEKLRTTRPAVGPARPRTLAAYAAHHLKQKAINHEAEPQWMGNAEVHLRLACEFFSDTIDLAKIQPADITDYVTHLRTMSNRRGGVLSAGSVNHYLNSLSNLFRRAIADGVLAIGSNPVGALFARPTGEKKSTLWLEVHEMAAILKAAKAYVPERSDLALPYFFEVLATMALTGCRESEVYGIRRSELLLDRSIILIQPNAWRRLKTVTSSRAVPVFSQLRDILAAYLASPYAPQGDLLFPGVRADTEQMITDLRKPFDHMPMPERLGRPRTDAELEREMRRRRRKLVLAERGRRGWMPRETREELIAPIPLVVVPPLRSRMLRHTYCAARLQTLDNGKPISIYTVVEELGHADITMVKKVYAHLGRFRARGEEVEYRWAA
jgi:integrase